MKKIIICNVPMKANVDQVVYESNDLSLPVSERAVRYPVNAFLEKTISSEDELKVLVLVKKDEYSHYEKNTQDFIDELTEVTNSSEIKIEYKILDTDFEQSQAVHEQLMLKIVEELEVGAHIIADITYGSKDVPIVLFAALNFAEKFLNCEIDNLLYGKASFDGSKPVNTKICDMMPLYCLNGVTDTIRCDEPEKAMQMLRTLLSL